MHLTRYANPIRRVTRSPVLSIKGTTMWWVDFLFHLQVFVIDTFLCQYSANSKGFTFQLFNNILLLSPEATRLLLPETKGGCDLEVTLLTYNGMKFITFSKDGIVSYDNKANYPNEMLVNNIISYLTDGNCKDHRRCYHSIDERIPYVRNKNHVFWISSIIDLNANTFSDILRNHWPIIFSYNLMSTISTMVRGSPETVKKLCGDLQVRKHEVKGNICRDIMKTTYKG